MHGTVLVIFGGVSNESEISVITGTMTANILKNGGDSVVCAFIARDGVVYTGDGLSDINNYKDDKYLSFPRAAIANGGVYVLNKRGKFRKFVKVDVALNCCHGGVGEGGGISGLCAVAGIPLASAGIFESSAFMDKYLTKLVLSSLGVRTVDYAYIRSAVELERAELPSFPVIVKPVSLGSSIGVEKADNVAELETAVLSALMYDGAVIVEKYIENRREINCAAYYSKGKVITSECEEAMSGGDILSFDDKYQGGGKSILPANLPRRVSDQIKKITEDVYSRLGMRGIVRFDFILSGANIYVSEINTVPGSLSFYLLSGGFKDFYNVLCAVLKQAVKDGEAVKKRKLLSTGILNNLPDNVMKLGAK